MDGDDLEILYLNDGKDAFEAQEKLTLVRRWVTVPWGTSPLRPAFAPWSAANPPTPLEAFRRVADAVREETVRTEGEYVPRQLPLFVSTETLARLEDSLPRGV